MKPLRLPALPVLALGLLAAGAGAQTPTYLDPNDPVASAGNQGTVKIFHIGPYTIPAARIVNNRLIPGEFENIVFAPNPGDGWLTGYDNRIVDLNYLPVDQYAPEGGSDFYLHHAVFVNLAASDLTCPVLPGERFAASGGERMPIALPNGYGYRIRATDSIRCILHLQNFTLQTQQVYLQYSMTMQPPSASYVAVRPWWLDVVLCTSTYFVPVGTGTHVQQRDYTAPRPMTLLSMGPHLHCGGMQIDLVDKASGQAIWTFFNNPAACPVEMEAVLPNPRIAINVGQTVTIKATYQQSPSAAIDAMGIVLAYAVVQ